MSEPRQGMLALPVSESRDHIQGPRDAIVTLLEYGDFECPHCGRARPIVKGVMEELGDRARFVFRNFPLSQMHPHAQLAAEAAEAAGAQGRFWEMHDILFENQGALEDEDLVSYAAALSIDVDRFTAELAQHTHADRVREDFLSGVRSGVNGTPSFFINGMRHDGAWDARSLGNAILLAMSRPHEHGGHDPHRPHHH